MSEDTQEMGSGAQARIKKLIEKNKALEAQLAESSGYASKIEKLEGQIQTISGQLIEAQTGSEAQLAQLTKAHSVERALLARGITGDEGINIAKMVYNSLPEDTRPEIGEWLAGELPRAVSAYLPQTAPPPAPPTEPGQAAPDPAPSLAIAQPKSNGTIAKPVYDGRANLKAATSNSENWRQSRNEFLTDDGFLKPV